MCKASASSRMEDELIDPKLTNTAMNKNDNSNNASYTSESASAMHPAATTSSRSADTVTVCCGCRPKAKRNNRKFRKIEPTGEKWWKKAAVKLNSKYKGSATKISNWRYRDADGGEDSEWKAFHRNNSSNDDGRESIKSDDEEMYFFDAVDRPLGDDEYPITGYAIGAQKFKVVFTTSIEHPAPRVSLEDPDSMLRPRSRASSSAGSVSSIGDFEDAYELEPIHPPNQKARIANLKEPSLRFRKIRKRSCEALTAELKQPQTTVSDAIEDAIGMAGYPGKLTMEELEECQKFVRRLNDLPSNVAEQIYSLRDIEDQPYTICRWLRATKFDADAILARCAENQPLFEEAKEHNFYGPDLEDHLGCPFSVFLSQYPFLSIGRGFNGSPVNYFHLGNVNPEGLLCLITIEQLKSYFWYSFMYTFKDNVRASQAENPDFCRCEGINVLDLSGLSATSLNSDTMEVIKLSSKISDFFPETLHCMLVVNAPNFFTFSWKLIRNFIDQRTASRIQLFSLKNQGLKALERLVAKDQIPSDYGGGNISLQEAFLKECTDPQIVKQEIELIHCRRRQKKQLLKAWSLKEDEYIEITVYTRSVVKAYIQVQLNGSTIKTVHAQCKFVPEASGGTKPHPTKTVVIACLAGPGQVNVEAKDLDTPISKSHSHCSRGYFLVVGDIKKSEAPIPSPGSENRRVSFKSDTVNQTTTKDDDGYSTNQSNNIYYPYANKPPTGAKVTMTGLDFPKPIKVPPKTERTKKKKRMWPQRQNQ